jgi:hypothetical protein
VQNCLELAHCRPRADNLNRLARVGVCQSLGGLVLHREPRRLRCSDVPWRGRRNQAAERALRRTNHLVAVGHRGFQSGVVDGWPLEAGGLRQRGQGASTISASGASGGAAGSRIPHRRHPLRPNGRCAERCTTSTAVSAATNSSSNAVPSRHPALTSSSFRRCREP